MGAEMKRDLHLYMLLAGGVGCQDQLPMLEDESAIDGELIEASDVNRVDHRLFDRHISFDSEHDASIIDATTPHYDINQHEVDSSIIDSTTPHYDINQSEVDSNDFDVTQPSDALSEADALVDALTLLDAEIDALDFGLDFPALPDIALLPDAEAPEPCRLSIETSNTAVTGYPPSGIELRGRLRWSGECDQVGYGRSEINIKLDDATLNLAQGDLRSDAIFSWAYSTAPDYQYMATIQEIPASINNQEIFYQYGDSAVDQINEVSLFTNVVAYRAPSYLITHDPIPEMSIDQESNLLIINGVSIQPVDVMEGDEDFSLINAINQQVETVKASKDQHGRLILRAENGLQTQFSLRQRDDSGRIIHVPIRYRDNVPNYGKTRILLFSSEPFSLSPQGTSDNPNPNVVEVDLNQAIVSTVTSYSMISGAGDSVKVNDVEMRSTSPEDDPISHSEFSMIALSNMLEEASERTGVHAEALGVEIWGDLPSQDIESCLERCWYLCEEEGLSINGVLIADHPPRDLDEYLSLINSNSENTGVNAWLDSSGRVVFSSQDGRYLNIMQDHRFYCQFGFVSSDYGSVLLSSDSSFAITYGDYVIFVAESPTLPGYEHWSLSITQDNEFILKYSGRNLTPFDGIAFEFEVNSINFESTLLTFSNLGPPERWNVAGLRHED